MSDLCTVITGANRGLGLHLARALRPNAQHLVLVGRTTADFAAIGFEAPLSDVEQVECDLRDLESLTRFALQMDGRSVDLLINNAGVFSQNESDGIGGMTPAAISDMLMVNAVAPTIIARMMLDRLVSGALIVNILSDMAFPADWDGTYPIYRAGKALLWSLTVNMQAELARRDAKVIGIDPGWMWTDMGGPEAPDDPAQIAIGIAALCEKRKHLQSGAVYRAGDSKLILTPGGSELA